KTLADYRANLVLVIPGEPISARIIYEVSPIPLVLNSNRSISYVTAEDLPLNGLISTEEQVESPVNLNYWFTSAVSVKVCASSYVVSSNVIVASTVTQKDGNQASYEKNAYDTGNVWRLAWLSRLESSCTVSLTRSEVRGQSWSLKDYGNAVVWLNASNRSD